MPLTQRGFARGQLKVTARARVRRDEGPNETQPHAEQLKGAITSRTVPHHGGGARGRHGLRLGSAFGCGFLISLVIAPCGTPVLASALSYAAYQRTVSYGAMLLFLYGFGAGVPLLVAATASARLAQKLEVKGYLRGSTEEQGFCCWASACICCG